MRRGVCSDQPIASVGKALGRACGGPVFEHVCGGAAGTCR